MAKVTQLISEGLGLKPRQSLWGPHPYLLYHNALNASHPSATASCVWLDPNDPQKDPGPRLPGAEQEGRSGAGLSLPRNRAADGNWGRFQGIFFQAGVRVRG